MYTGEYLESSSDGDYSYNKIIIKKINMFMKNAYNDIIHYFHNTNNI